MRDAFPTLPGPIPRIGELYGADAERDGEWEGMLVGKRLHLYCYLRGMVVALAPLDCATEPRDAIRR